MCFIAFEFSQLQNVTSNSLSVWILNGVECWCVLFAVSNHCSRAEMTINQKKERKKEKSARAAAHSSDCSAATHRL